MTTTPPDPAPEPDTEPDTEESGLPFEAPKDIDDEASTGYAVYDRQLGSYVTGVTAKRADAAKDAKGDHLTVVRV